MSLYPTNDLAARQKIRDDQSRQQVQGRSLKCSAIARMHAGAPGGCANNGSTCICECHEPGDAVKSIRVAGHSLRGEGAAHDSWGREIEWLLPVTPAPGHAKCSCGVVSPELPSGRARRRWHAEHKLAVKS